MIQLRICEECDKPDPKTVKGRARSGKALIRALAKEELSFEIVACDCVGNCSKGPNGVAMPGRKPLHRLSLKKIRKLCGGNGSCSE